MIWAVGSSFPNTSASGSFSKHVLKGNVIADLYSPLSAIPHSTTDPSKPPMVKKRNLVILFILTAIILTLVA
jgi:hypothetical protein